MSQDVKIGISYGSSRAPAMMLQYIFYRKRSILLRVSARGTRESTGPKSSFLNYFKIPYGFGKMVARWET